MASQTLFSRVIQGVSGIFLLLTGSWLGVICLGGLITLGIVSVFHLGVLLSLGCVGVCLLVGGACLLCETISASPRQNALLEELEEDYPHKLQKTNRLDKKNNSKNITGSGESFQTVYQTERKPYVLEQQQLSIVHDQRNL